MTNGRNIKPPHIVRHEHIQPERDRYLPKHFETELRAFVSHKLATTNLKPEDIVAKLHEVAKSWGMINLQVRFFDDKED